MRRVGEVGLEGRVGSPEKKGLLNKFTQNKLAQNKLAQNKFMLI